MLSSPPRRQFLCGYLARVRFVISVKKYRKNTLLLTKNLWFLLPNEIILKILSIFEFPFHFTFLIHWQSNILCILFPPLTFHFHFCAIIMCVVKGLCKFWGNLDWVWPLYCGSRSVWETISLDIIFSLSIDLSRGFIYLEVRLIM